MLERDGKDQGEDSPKASVLVLLRPPLSISHKRSELVSSGRVDATLPFSGVSFRFRLFAFIKHAALRSMVLRYDE